MVTTPERVSSWADSFSGSLDANGSTTIIAPFALVSGAAPRLTTTTTVGSFENWYDLTPGMSNSLSLLMQGTHMVNTADSAGIGIDNIGASGTSDLRSAIFC
jgi:hypothetical protein